MGVGGEEERVSCMINDESEVGVMATDAGVEGVRQEAMVEEEVTQRVAAAPGSRSTVGRCKVKQSRRHNFDTTPSAFAHGNVGSAAMDFVSGDECEDDHGRDGGDVVRLDDEAGEGVAQRVADAVQVAADAGDENILTTFMVVNAAVLLEATGNKIKEFRALVKRTEPKPHVIDSGS